MELSHDDFALLLQRWEADRDTAEGRRTPRVLTRRRVTLIFDPDDALLGQIEVILQDISRGGVRVSHHEGMPLGKRFTLLLGAGSASPLSLVCVVRHCRMLKNDFFQIGAEFEAIGELGS